MKDNNELDKPEFWDEEMEDEENEDPFDRLDRQCAETAERIDGKINRLLEQL